MYIFKIIYPLSFSSYHVISFKYRTNNTCDLTPREEMKNRKLKLFFLTGCWMVKTQGSRFHVKETEFGSVCSFPDISLCPAYIPVSTAPPSRDCDTPLRSNRTHNTSISVVLWWFYPFLSVVFFKAYPIIPVRILLRNTAGFKEFNPSWWGRRGRTAHCMAGKKQMAWEPSCKKWQSLAFFLAFHLIPSGIGWLGKDDADAYTVSIHLSHSSTFYTSS